MKRRRLRRILQKRMNLTQKMMRTGGKRWRKNGVGRQTLL